MVLLSFTLCFASGLELVDSYPRDGGGGLQPENVMVKLYFNEDVSAKNVQDINKGCFKFTDEKGIKIPITVLYNDKNLDQIWVLVNENLKPDSTYKLEISGELQTSSGDTLEKDTKVEFKTRNTGTDTQVNMGLMAVMVVGMLVFSSISMKRNLKKEAAENSDNKVNPYKVAKETGKSVKDIVAKTEKEKEKAQAKKNRGNSESTKSDNTSSMVQSDNDSKKVTKARPISATGSTFITGRKAKAEAEAAKAAARAASKTTNPKNATGKSKNTKAKKK